MIPFEESKKWSKKDESTDQKNLGLMVYVGLVVKVVFRYTLLFFTTVFIDDFNVVFLIKNVRDELYHLYKD